MMPGPLQLNIYRGDTHVWRFTLWQDAQRGQPVDLLGVTAKAEIRDRPGGSVIQPITVAITLPNIVDCSLMAAITGQLPTVLNAGRWDLQLTDTLGWVSTILAGPVKVTGDITDSTGEPAVAAACKLAIW